tara:strand:+ start:46826 stop:47053 length:228 start_codon:yes stop_codon:yes gene_type:complete
MNDNYYIGKYEILDASADYNVKVKLSGVTLWVSANEILDEYGIDVMKDTFIIDLANADYENAMIMIGRIHSGKSD